MCWTIHSDLLRWLETGCAWSGSRCIDCLEGAMWVHTNDREWHAFWGSEGRWDFFIVHILSLPPSRPQWVLFNACESDWSLTSLRNAVGAILQWVVEVNSCQILLFMRWSSDIYILSLLLCYYSLNLSFGWGNWTIISFPTFNYSLSMF